MVSRLLALLVTISLVAVGSCSQDRSTGTGVAPSESAPEPQGTSLRCERAFDAGSEPPESSTVVLDVVALPTSDGMREALQTSASGEPDPAARLFAKQGLVVRSGASFVLEVPADAVDRLSIGWSNPDERTRRLVIDACPGSSKWLAFVGGYWVKDPGCMPLVVRAGGQERRVTIGVGAPCPGQRPPPAPSDP